MVRGGARRKRQVDILPSLEIGWDKNGIDVIVAFLFWYGYVEIWRVRK